MEQSFKDHKGPITCIKISSNGDECLTASADGSCIVWNLRRGARQNALFASTVFKSIAYHPDESQLLTCGTDRKITYWDAVDCTAIRVMDGGVAEVNSLDITQDGSAFVTGGSDRLVKMWLYDEGTIIAAGHGHSGPVSRVKISPDGRSILSVGAEGAIFLWSVPEGFSAHASGAIMADSRPASESKRRA